MNKIYSEQIQKALMLSEGIKKNDSTLKQSGINIETERIDAIAKSLKEASDAQDAAEQELSARRNAAHAYLTELKNLCNAAKLPIKENFPLEQWQKFGLTDKR